VLLEVLLAAAILATAVVALTRLQDAALRREGTSATVAAAMRAAERLVNETGFADEPTEGTQQGDLPELPGGIYRRQVLRLVRPPAGWVYLVRVRVTWLTRAGEEELTVESYVLKGPADAERG
jgi:hypothetical protein